MDICSASWKAAYCNQRLTASSTITPTAVDKMKSNRNDKNNGDVSGGALDVHPTTRNDDDAHIEIESTEEAANTSKKASVFLPVELYPTILSYCPFSTLAQTRAVCKTFRDVFVAKESFFRHDNVDDSIKKIRKIYGQRIIDSWWGSTLESTVEKAITMAKPLFFGVAPYWGGDEPEANDPDGGRNVLLAKEYNEEVVRQHLLDQTVVLGANWRIEARHELRPLSDAFKEVKVGIHGGRPGPLNLLMTAAPGQPIHIAECEVSIQQTPLSTRQISAFQVISFESVDGGISALVAEATPGTIRY